MGDRVSDVLAAVARGELTVSAARALLADGDATDLGFAVIDDHRAVRTGLPEVVYGEGKSPAQIAAIFNHLDARGHKALATRVDADKAAAVQALLPGARYAPVPRLLWHAPSGAEPFAPTREGQVWVLSAGTSDAPVAEEAAQCAAFFGLDVHSVVDVGVAGLHRLLSRAADLQQARVIIVVAGMEGALPSVVAGLVRAPVVAVPTSVGYGTHFGGLTPLLAMLNACASGVSVVNVDNGFGAALVAWRIVAGGTR